MRTRIRARARSPASRAAREPGDAALAAELQSAARATERAWVMTIHAFCRRLLAPHPLAAGLDPRFRVLDAGRGRRGSPTGRRPQALDDLLAAGDEDVARAAAAYQPWRLAAMTLAAHARLRSQGMSEPRLPRGRPTRCTRPGEARSERALTPAELEAAALGARRRSSACSRASTRATRELKEERSALDFQDLELRALELLRVEPGARPRPGASASTT